MDDATTQVPRPPITQAEVLDAIARVQVAVDHARAGADHCAALLGPPYEAPIRFYVGRAAFSADPMLWAFGSYGVGAPTPYARWVRLFVRLLRGARVPRWRAQLRALGASAAEVRVVARHRRRRS